MGSHRPLHFLPHDLGKHFACNLMNPNEDIDADVELMEAAYGCDFRRLESYNDCVRFSVKLSTAVVVTISLPSDFPTSPIHCTVDGTLPITVIYELNKVVKSKIDEDPGIRSMDVCQCVSDYVINWETERKQVETICVNKPCELKIARFLVYFHHIMSSTKRKAIVDNAEELQLGGISKTGFPGVVIIEGLLENVLEYVRRIQRLRWQQMVVRGEEIETIELCDPTEDLKDKFSTLRNGDSSVDKGKDLSTVNLGGDPIERLIDKKRKLPTFFRELPNTTDGGGMSAVGAFCKECHIHALFMTAMKKYDANTSA